MQETTFKRIDADELDAAIDVGVERAGVTRELTGDEVAAVNGGALGTINSMHINPRWLGLWPREWFFNAKTDIAINVDPMGPDEFNVGHGNVPHR